MANTYQTKTKNTCIITGVAGYIGLNLAEFFLKQNYKVYGIDNFYSGDRKAIKKLKKKFKNFIFYEKDIEKFKKKIKSNNLIHLQLNPRFKNRVLTLWRLLKLIS